MATKLALAFALAAVAVEQATAGWCDNKGSGERSPSSDLCGGSALEERPLLLLLGDLSIANKFSLRAGLQCPSLSGCRVCRLLLAPRLTKAPELVSAADVAAMIIPHLALVP